MAIPQGDPYLTTYKSAPDATLNSAAINLHNSYKTYYIFTPLHLLCFGFDYKLLWYIV